MALFLPMADKEWDQILTLADPHSPDKDSFVSKGRRFFDCEKIPAVIDKLIPMHIINS